jgi:copper resistance protein B
MSHESMDHDQKTKRQIEIMTSKFLRPTLMALAVSTSPAFFAVANAAEEMDHGRGWTIARWGPWITAR